MCKKAGVEDNSWRPVNEKLEVTLENIERLGKDAFDDKEVFALLSNHIKETNYIEEPFCTYLCIELFKKLTFDKVTLTYLANYYIGGTDQMVVLWKALKTYGIPAHKIGERIITQMVFSENLYDEEEIFLDCYRVNVLYFRVKQAYLTLVSREYIILGRELKACVFEIIAKECEQREELPDLCKAALLCYYANNAYTKDMEDILHKVLKELCAKQILFADYLKYPESWLVEVQLYNKVLLEIRTAATSRVRLNYKMKKGQREELGFHSEILKPIFGQIFVKSFILYEGEVISYFVEELHDKKVTRGEEQELYLENKVTAVGKYGRLNAIARAEEDKKRKMILAYKEEEILAEEIFRA
jgi:hypothetical protein